MQRSYYSTLVFVANYQSPSNHFSHIPESLARSMDLPVTTPNSNSGNHRTRYRIRTKNLSFELSLGRYYELSWVFGEKANHERNTYVLKDVNFEAKPGEITAIAGPSGAGKTTLLEVIAGMISPCKVSGYVLLNGKPMNPTYFQRVCGYITQDEALFPLLTVEETLMYSARLRLHRGQNKASNRVRELLKELGLDHVASSRIGNESTRGISGGEKRRVSIGVELVHDPAVLLIDEATSGLDSAAALHVMLLLKSMAKNQGKTILLTIHQPGFRILEAFDQVVLLSNGIVLHHGSLHLLEERLKFDGRSIPRQVNVLEFAIDVAESLLADIEEKDIDISVVKQEYEHIRTLSDLDGVEEKHMVYANSLLSEVMILSQRFSYNIFRTKQLFVAKMLQALLVGVLLGTIFMNVNRFKLQTQIGFFAFSLTFLLYSTSEALPIFLHERRILMRETSSGAYRTASYTISNTLVFLPFLFVVAFLYTTPVYWLVGLRRDIDGFLYFSLVVWLVFLMSNSFVACFSALVPDFIMGMSLVAGLMGSFFLFSGYFISKDDIPKYWMFMHYLSLFKYPFECFMLNEFGGEKGKSRCLERIEGECLLSGEAFLMKQNLKESQKWTNLVWMLGFVIGYRFFSLLILWYRSYRSRN